MPELVVAHRDLSGAIIAEFENPPALKWTYQIGAKGPGRIEYSLAESDPAMGRDAFGPKRTDFVLSDGGTALMDGVIQSVQDAWDEDKVDVVGEDFLCWLDQSPLLAFDYDEIFPVAFGDVDKLIMVFSTITTDNLTETTTVEDVLNQLLAPLMFDLSEQIPIYTNLSGSAFAEIISGHWERSPEQTVLDAVNTLAQMGSPFGFDHWFEPGFEYHLVGPRRTNPASVTPTYAITASSGDVVAGTFVNDGPAATDIVFTEGGGAAKFYYHKQHQASIDQYRRWSRVVGLDGGDSGTFQIGGDTQNDYKAQAAQNRMMFPQRRLSLTVRPDNGFGYGNRVMEAIDVDWEKYAGSYHRVDSFWWVIGQTYYLSDEGSTSGEWLCDLSLEQINVPIS